MRLKREGESEVSLEFQPTKWWVREHKARPRECVNPEIQCCCILDHFNKHGHGFCTGISLDKSDSLDIIRFCDITYCSEDNTALCATRQWHPSEAQLVATYLSFAVTQSWQLMKEYRKQLGIMGRKRSKDINSKTRKGEQV